MIQVVCGIIFKNEKVLICQRKLSKSQGGLWEFPGGKVENNESNTKTLKRELIEELNLSVNNLKYFTSNIHKYDKVKIELIAYTCEYVKSEIIMREHENHEWKHISEISIINLSPADIPILKELKKAKVNNT